MRVLQSELVPTLLKCDGTRGKNVKTGTRYGVENYQWFWVRWLLGRRRCWQWPYCCGRTRRTTYITAQISRYVSHTRAHHHVTVATVAMPKITIANVDFHSIENLSVE